MKPQQKHLLSWNTSEGQQIVTAQAACVQHDGHWVSGTDPEVLSIVKLADETFSPSWSACNVRCMRVTSVNGAVFSLEQGRGQCAAHSRRARHHDRDQREQLNSVMWRAAKRRYPSLSLPCKPCPVSLVECILRPEDPPPGRSLRHLRHDGGSVPCPPHITRAETVPFLATLISLSKNAVAASCVISLLCRAHLFDV